MILSCLDPLQNSRMKQRQYEQFYLQVKKEHQHEWYRFIAKGPIIISYICICCPSWSQCQIACSRREWIYNKLQLLRLVEPGLTKNIQIQSLVYYVAVKIKFQQPPCQIHTMNINWQKIRSKDPERLLKKNYYQLVSQQEALKVEKNYKFEGKGKSQQRKCPICFKQVARQNINDHILTKHKKLASIKQVKSLNDKNQLEVSRKRQKFIRIQCLFCTENFYNSWQLKQRQCFLLLDQWPRHAIQNHFSDLPQFCFHNRDGNQIKSPKWYLNALITLLRFQNRKSKIAVKIRAQERFKNVKKINKSNDLVELELESLSIPQQKSMQEQRRQMRLVQVYEKKKRDFFSIEDDADDDEQQEQIRDILSKKKKNQDQIIEIIPQKQAKVTEKQLEQQEMSQSKSVYQYFPKRYTNQKYKNQLEFYGQKQYQKVRLQTIEQRIERLKRVYSVPTKTISRKKMIPVYVPGHYVLGKDLTFNKFKLIFYRQWFKLRYQRQMYQNPRAGSCYWISSVQKQWQGMPPQTKVKTFQWMLRGANNQLAQKQYYFDSEQQFQEGSSEQQQDFYQSVTHGFQYYIFTRFPGRYEPYEPKKAKSNFRKYKQIKYMVRIDQHRQSKLGLAHLQGQFQKVQEMKEDKEAQEIFGQVSPVQAQDEQKGADKAIKRRLKKLKKMKE